MLDDHVLDDGAIFDQCLIRQTFGRPGKYVSHFCFYKLAKS